MIGLKHGTVALSESNPEWHIIAMNTVGKLYGILGSAAVDIQHVGSTAIKGIKAKPIIDIAVGVPSFSDIDKFQAALTENGFYRRSQDVENEVLYVCGDIENETRTHHIHFVIHGGVEWRHYILFRDYLNAHPSEASAYERLKETLASKYPSDRKSYTAGKAEFINKILKKADDID